MFAPCKKNCDKPRQHVKKQRRHFVGKGPYSQSYDFPSSHIQVWELDHKKDLSTAELEISSTRIVVLGKNSSKSLEEQGDQTSQS